MDSPYDFATICPPLNQTSFPVVDDKLRTELMLASGKNEVEKVLNLISVCDPKWLPAYLNQVDKSGHTALMHAALSGAMAVVEALIAAGTEVNFKNGRGLTALFVAQCWDRKEIVDLLNRYQNPTHVMTGTGSASSRAGHGCIEQESTQQFSLIRLSKQRTYVPTVTAAAAFRSLNHSFQSATMSHNNHVGHIGGNVVYRKFS